MKPSDHFISDEEQYLEYLEELAEECEEEVDQEDEEQDVDDLVSEADLAALAETDDDEGQEDEPSPEGEEEVQGDEAAEADAQQAGDEQESAESDPAPDTDRQAQEQGQGSYRGSTLGTLESVQQSLEQLNEKLDDIDARRDKLEADWDDGEIEDRDKYKAQMRALRAEERETNRQERLLDLQRDRIEVEERQIQATWQKSVEAFMTENPDYARVKSLQEELREQIGILGQSQSWLDKGNEAILAEALRLSDERVGRVSKTKVAPEVADPKDELSSRRDVMKGRGKRVDAPKTLGGLPAAEEAPIQRDEFSQIDDLPGDKREDAIARMSPEKREQYLAQA